MEAADAPPSTSKVIIQCTDPDNLLETFESRLSSRTPLRNLHWKSPTRPLRSIPSLNISLVRKDPSQNGAQSGVRRHQIPGLRETPYVKLYLLRCDDRETYKESARKEIKQWIKDNTLEKESKTSLRNHEHHDAYEWMIVHVVVPSTAAAAQPKSSKHISLDNTDSTDSVNSKSKWTGKSSSTIFDKLRADFGSSKSAIPRVAQIRITEQGKPQGALSPSEIEEQWQDLVDNLKAAILKSFDTRVSEYEEDIRERENQRSLPGWNFCTFFVLKEGLARGFENVGLLEDALAAYSELELCLDLIVKESHERDDIEGGGALLPYSKNIKTIIRQALDEATESSSRDVNGHSEAFDLKRILESDSEQDPLRIEGTHYRDLILSNQVSALDLRIYVFTRKMEIWFRQARSSETTNANAKPVKMDINVVADFAELALEFINLAAREYRTDLYAAWGGRLSGGERLMQKVVIGNLVATWTWSAITQVLARTLPVLETPISQLDKAARDVLHNLVVRSLNDTEEKRPVSQERPVSSTTSSPHRGIRSQSLPRGASASKEGLDASAPGMKAPPRPGLDRLYAWIANLVLLDRSVLEELQATLPWTEQLRNLDLPGHQQRSKRLQRLSSYHPSHAPNGPVSGFESGEAPEENKLLCLKSATLRQAAASQNAFHELYRFLSAFACHLFRSAGHSRAAKQALTDLAGQAYSSDNKSLAAKYLSRVLDSDLRSGGASCGAFAVALYAQCLKEDDRPNEYARCLLACLRSSPARESMKLAQGYLNELVSIAALVDPFEVPLGSILNVNEADKAISHFGDRDGFYLSVRLQSSLRLSLTADIPMKLHLVATGQQDPSELTLEAPSKLDLGSKPTTLSFSSSVNTEGWYDFERLEMKLGNFLFVHHFQQDPDDELSVRQRISQPPAVMVYTRSDALSVEMMPATTIVHGETRMLSLTLCASKIAVSSCGIRLRAASAGLRLHLYDSRSTTPLAIARNGEAFPLRLEEIEAESCALVEVPYTVENTAEASIMVRCEVQYEARGQSFSLYKTCVVDVILPVSVTVQDIHRDSHWFSRFWVSPATLVPIFLLRCSIDDHPEIDSQSGSTFEHPLMVFPQQPASWTVRLNQRHLRPHSKQQLTLRVYYQCVDELILNMVKESFSSHLKQSPCAQAASFLSSHVVRTVKNGWTEQDLEVAGLTREADIWPMQDLDWPAVLCAFDQVTKEGLRNWIQEWHSRACQIPIELERAPVRELTLLVDLLKRPPVVKTGLRLRNQVDTAPVGQPLICELAFELSTDDDRDDMQDLDFAFELFAPQDAWLIGGTRKGSFRASPAGTTLQIVLFPQRTGLVLLPMVDVRCRRRNDDDPKAVGGWMDVPIEVHNHTLSKCIQVTTNLKSTTIALTSDEATHMSSGAMVDSQNWEQT